MAKQVLGRPVRGPKAVESSLARGFREIGQEFVLNIWPPALSGTACILSGPQALKYAINQKEQGNIKKIVAGPNVAMPWEDGGVIFHKDLDIFLVPSQWVADYCLTFKGANKNKIKVWASGVETLPLPGSEVKRDTCIIFCKNAPEEVYNAVVDGVTKKGLNYVILRYGNFSHNKYIELLNKAMCIIYLSGSESQGLALHEAWMLDVPTLVWDGGYMKIGSYEWQSSSPAPYLNEQCGKFFNKLSDFPEKLNEFLSQKFLPRQYHLENFTDKITAQKYLEIINS